MRAFIVGLASSLVALAGFAGSASASATIDLLWAGSGTATTSGFVTSSNITLNVVLTAGALGALGGGMSIDYTALVGDFTVVSFQSFQVAPLTTGIGVTSDSGTQINNFNAVNFAGGLAAGESYLLGTVTFNATTGTPGSFQIDSGAFAITDDIIAGDFSIITGTTTFNSATASPVPEPGTLSLLGMGLGGLYVVGRRSSRKH
jgi:hypothetical protein